MPTIITRSRDTDHQADVGRFALLLVIVVLIIGLLGLVGAPDESGRTGTPVRIILTILTGGVLLLTVRIARLSLQHQRWFSALIGILMFIATISLVFTTNPLFEKIGSFLWLFLVIATPALVLRKVLAADDVTIQTILGSITVYLLIGVTLTLLSIAMQQSVGFFEVAPRSTAYVYFAFVTITTIGYGDLSPYTDGARMVSVTAAVIAQMYLVIVVARLVSIWKPSQSAKPSGENR